MNKDITTKYYVLDFQFNKDKNYKNLLNEIYKVFKNNLDLTYIKSEFDYWQIRQIVAGLISKVDVSVYAKKEFKSEQMNQIREGLEAGINVNVYARPEFRYDKMRKLKEILLPRDTFFRDLRFGD